MITKNMLIADVLEKNSDHAPEIAEAMIKAGMHCVGCCAAKFETLEQGMKTHGKTDEEIDALVSELNQVCDKTEEPKATSETPKDETAKVVMGDKEIEIKPGEKIKDACAKMGVVIACDSGVCGACEIEVEEGMENLTEHTEEELDMGMDENRRLACQCRLKKGAVKIKYNM